MTLFFFLLIAVVITACAGGWYKLWSVPFWIGVLAHL